MTISDQPGLFGDIGAFSPWHQEEMDKGAEIFVSIPHPGKRRSSQMVELRVSRTISGGWAWDYHLNGTDWGCGGPFSDPCQTREDAQSEALAFLASRMGHFTPKQQATIRAATGRHVLTGDGAAWPWVVI